MSGPLDAPEIYLDHHATTPCDPAVLERMLPVLREDFGNPSSTEHRAGQRASRRVEAARAEVARWIGADEREVIFTSGATESNNLALQGVARQAMRHAPQAGRVHLVTSRIEHRAVLDTCGLLERAGVEVTYLRASAEGLVDPRAVAEALRPETALVSLHWANNEVGSIQDVEAVGAACRQAGVLFHCDAAQALPWLACDVDRLSIDLLSISAHKAYGPKGVGALYVRRRRPRVRLEPLFAGGGQERGLRSGTHNVPGIVGLGAAASLALERRSEDHERVRSLRDEWQSRLVRRFPGLRVLGPPRRRLPNNLNVLFPDLAARSVIRCLEGVAVSSGSACSSGTEDSAWILRALDIEGAERGSLRFGLGRQTTRDELVEAESQLVEAVVRARAAPTEPIDTC